MKIKAQSLPTLLSAAFAALIVPGSARSQDEAKPPEGDPAAAMEAYLKLMAPGPEHQKLKRLAGTWSAKQKLWMAPGTPPQESDGTAKFYMAMGGRFLVQNYASEIPGMGKFQGRATTAYDKVAEEYIGTWIDSLNTAILISRGKAVGGNTLEMTGESVDPFTKEKGTFRTVSTFVDEDTHKVEMFEKKGKEAELKIMEILYTRTSGPIKKKGGAEEAGTG